jgi:hypothetical protein
MSLSGAELSKIDDSFFNMLEQLGDPSDPI